MQTRKFFYDVPKCTKSICTYDIWRSYTEVVNAAKSSCKDCDGHSYLWMWFVVSQQVQVRNGVTFHLVSSTSHYSLGHTGWWGLMLALPSFCSSPFVAYSWTRMRPIKLKPCLLISVVMVYFFPNVTIWLLAPSQPKFLNSSMFPSSRSVYSAIPRGTSRRRGGVYPMYKSGGKWT